MAKSNDPFADLDIAEAIDTAEQKAVDTVKELGGEIARLARGLMRSGDKPKLELLLQRAQAIIDGTDTGNNGVTASPEVKRYPLLSSSGQSMGRLVTGQQAENLGLVAVSDGEDRLVGFMEAPPRRPRRELTPTTPVTIPIVDEHGNVRGTITPEQAEEADNLRVVMKDGVPFEAKLVPDAPSTPPQPTSKRRRTRPARRGH